MPQNFEKEMMCKVLLYCNFMNLKHLKWCIPPGSEGMPLDTVVLLLILLSLCQAIYTILSFHIANAYKLIFKHTQNVIRI